MKYTSCVISGSFRKYYNKIVETSRLLEKNGIKVLAPKASKIINPGEEFLILESDLPERDPKKIEDLHLKAIKNADFLLVYNLEGKPGISTTFEIGFAVAHNKPILVLGELNDIVLSKYVKKFNSINEILDYIRS